MQWVESNGTQYGLVWLGISPSDGPGYELHPTGEDIHVCHVWLDIWSELIPETHRNSQTISKIAATTIPTVVKLLRSVRASGTCRTLFREARDWVTPSIAGADTSRGGLSCRLHIRLCQTSFKMAVSQNYLTNGASEAAALENVSDGPPGDLLNYTFPRARLRQCMKDPSKTPLLLVACGSFSPITYLHLRSELPHTLKGAQNLIPR